MPTAKKRIVICSDGTWNDPEAENPTNVVRVARSIQPEDEHGVQQVVFYDWGVGTTYSKTRAGVSGLGIMKNIQDGYRFIVQNYDPGDEIFLFGFSRGAYTARALAGMLNKCGILKRSRAQHIPKAFDFYKQSDIKPSDDAASDWRKRHCVEAERGPVRFLGVWDTVGALGIPTRVLAFVDEADLFYDEELGSSVDVARHAVAIDELRKDFAPTLWKKKSAADLKQVWFAGVHSDVGGGVEGQKRNRASDIPLGWMVREADTTGLRFEKHVHGALDGLERVELSESWSLMWRLRGRQRPRRMPKGALVHRSVIDRHAATGYLPEPLAGWRKRNGNAWGSIED